MKTIKQAPEYRSTGVLFRVTETPWFNREGSRGGWGFRGETSYSNSETIYMWPVNEAAELEIKEYVAYVEACIDELVDAYGIEGWRLRGCPAGPIG